MIPWTSHGLSFKSPLSVTTLTTVRNRDYGSLFSNCFLLTGAMKGPAASGLTMRGVRRDRDSRSFSSPSEAFVV
jgi:hypothetical protein